MTCAALSSRAWTAGASGAGTTGSRRRTSAAAAGTSAAPSTGPSPALLDALLAISPHVVARGDVVWLDARGLPPRRTAARIAAAAAAAGVVTPRIGLAKVPLVAEVAARALHRSEVPAHEAPTHVIVPGAERVFLAPVPLATLGACDAAAGAWARRLVAALADVGLPTCGDLAALTAAAVELRFGAEGLALWHLARGTSDGTTAAWLAARFPPPGPALPSASLAWSTYELRDPTRLAFVGQRLVARVCADLAARGEGAREATLRFTLGGGSALERPVRGARPSADPAVWGRLVRAALERLAEGELPDGVVGLAFRVAAASGDAAPQGDLFDKGFQSAAAAEAALARVIDGGHGRPVALVASGHALPEHRVQTRVLEGEAAAAALRTAPTSGLPPNGAPLNGGGPNGGGPNGSGPNTTPATARASASSPALRLVTDTPRPGRGAAADARAHVPPHVPLVLGLDLLPAPRRVAVVTRACGDHRVPVTYRERADDAESPAPDASTGGVGRWSARGGRPLVTVLAAAGPDRVVVGLATGERVARDYWLCATDDGQLVMLYRELPADDAGGPPAGTDPDEGWHLQGTWE